MIDPHASHFYQRDYFHLNFYLSQKSLKMLSATLREKDSNLTKAFMNYSLCLRILTQAFRWWIFVFTHSVRRWSCSPGVQLSVEPPGRRCRSLRCRQWWLAAGGENDEKRDLSDVRRFDSLSTHESCQTKQSLKVLKLFKSFLSILQWYSLDFSSYK